MRRFSSLLLLLLAVATCTDAPGDILGPDTVGPELARLSRPGQVPRHQPGVVVVRFAAGAQASRIAAEHGAVPSRVLAGGARVLRVAEGSEEAVVRALSNAPGIVWAELSVPRTLGFPCTAGDGDCEPPADNLFGLRWDLHNDGAVRDGSGNVLWTDGLVPDADSDWLEAFDQLGAFTGSAVVGVIDTGIFGDHEDLAGRLIAQRDHFNVDDIAEDDNGHGTHVSGIALARGNNGVGAAGIAWGPNVDLVVSKGCGLVPFFGYICWSPDIADGIRWAVDNGANVVNLSLGGDSGSDVEQEALQYALANDVLPVCAAGNDQSSVDFPGAFPECMAVSSTDWGDQLASYSSFGPEVEVAAPGGDTILGSAYDRIASSWNDGGYAYAAGTSMASPHVAGLAALLHALGVTGAEEKRAIIRSTADDLGAPGFDPTYGDGRVNVWNAVLAALGGPPPPPPPNQPPTAGFTADCTDNVCGFTDASSDPDDFIASRLWDFGDGATSIASSPTHAYAAGGAYEVTLTVTDNGGLTDVAQRTVTVTDPPPNEPPTAGFSFSCTFLSCAFTDTSTDSDGSILEWSWDFGDGAGSAARSPTHDYEAGGTYTVTLSVTDDGGMTDTVEQAVTVTEPPPNDPPVADFTYGCTDLTCAFTDASSDPDGNITTWQWDFGDGTATSGSEATHTFPAAGTYTVSLTVTDAGGLSDTSQQDVTVTAPPPPPNSPPTADFTHACTDLTCAFTDASSDPDGNIATWQWDFGDGFATNAQSPTHGYGAAGTYTVTLTVTDAGGLTDETQQAVTVTEPEPPPPNEAPTAGFTYECTDLTCVFTDTSTDPDGAVAGWSWDFGDGTTTTAPNPTHGYPSGGTYTVTLTVTDDGGLSDVVQQAVTVTDPPPPPPNEAPTADFTYACTDLTCSFTDASSDADGSIVAWSWDFGDGTATTAASPTHAYGAAGTYTVTLTVTDDGGLTDVSQQDVTVTDPPDNATPVASFTYMCTDLTCAFTDASSDPDGSIVAWSWDFGDGTATTAPSPTHTYPAGGTYTVTLTVTDDGGLSDAAEQTLTVTAPPPPPNEAPTADFTHACTELTCAFTDASSDPDGSVVAWSWDFGDGTATTAPNPTHAYGAAGTYTVTLTVTDDGGLTDETQQAVTVSDPPPPPPNEPPTAGFTHACTNLACAFTDASSDPDGSVVAWSWDFGDGTTATAPSPVHAYPIGGTYTVTLTVTDDGGLSETTQQTVAVTDPIALSVSGSKERGRNVADLVWSGASTAVDVYRDGVLVATVPAGVTTHRDRTGSRGSATYVYRVCEAGSFAVCSNEVTLEF